MKPQPYIDENEHFVFAFQWCCDLDTLNNWLAFLPTSTVMCEIQETKVSDVKHNYHITPSTKYILKYGMWEEMISCGDWILKDNDYIWTLTDEEFKLNYKQVC